MRLYHTLVGTVASYVTEGFYGIIILMYHSLQYDFITENQMLAQLRIRNHQKVPSLARPSKLVNRQLLTTYMYVHTYIVVCADVLPIPPIILEIGRRENNQAIPSDTSSRKRNQVGHHIVRESIAREPD